MQNWRTATFGLRTLVNDPGAEIGILLLKITPLNNCMSSSVPPSFQCIFMLLRSKLVAVLKSQMLLMASRAIGASSVAFWLIILEDKEVFTHWRSFSSS